MQVSELSSNESVTVSHAHEQAAGKMNNSPYSTVGQSSSSDEMKLPGAYSVSLLQLPDEILIKIFLNLGGGSRIALGTTCKRFYNLIFSDKKLLRECNREYSGDLVEMLKCCRNLQSFVMSQKNFGGKVPLLDALIRNCPKLKDVGISGLSLEIKEVENKVIELIQSTEIVLFKSEDHQQLTTLLERLRKELDRPALRFETTDPTQLALGSSCDFWRNRELPYFFQFDTTIAQQLRDVIYSSL